MFLSLKGSSHLSYSYCSLTLASAFRLLQTKRRDVLTSGSNECVSQVFLRYQRALVSDFRFLLQPLVFKFPLKQASQHGPAVVKHSATNGFLQSFHNFF